MRGEEELIGSLWEKSFPFFFFFFLSFPFLSRKFLEPTPALYPGDGGVKKEGLGLLPPPCKQAKDNKGDA